MTGNARASFRSRLFPPSILLGGILALVLPSAVMLAADRKPMVHPTASTSTAPNSTAPATSRATASHEEQIAKVMEFFRVTQPDVYEQAKALRERDPGRFDRLIYGAAPTVFRLEAIRKRNPSLFDLSMQDLTLNYQSFRIAHELKRTDLSNDMRIDLRGQLGDIVAREFDVQQQIRQIEINDQKEKLQDLDDKIQERDQHKGKIIDKRVDDLIEKPPRLDW